MKYMYRSECCVDDLHFVNELNDAGIKYRFGFHYQQGEITLETDADLDTLRKLAQRVQDGHRIVQTINYHESYTGEMYFNDF